MGAEDPDEPHPSEWTAPPRDVPPPRPVAKPGRRPPAPGAELMPLPGGPSCGQDARLPDDAVDEPHDDEPAWLRERREEAEFAREFGDWRGGMSAGRSGGSARRSGGVRVAPLLLVLLAGVVLVLWLVV